MENTIIFLWRKWAYKSYLFACLWWNECWKVERSVKTVKTVNDMKPWMWQEDMKLIVTAKHIAETIVSATTGFTWHIHFGIHNRVAVFLCTVLSRSGNWTDHYSASYHFLHPSSHIYCKSKSQEGCLEAPISPCCSILLLIKYELIA